MADHCCNHEHEDKCAPPPLVLPQKTGVVQHQAGDACCSGGVPVFDGVDPRYKRVLWTVIAINAAMFVTEMVAGKLAGSQALTGRRSGLPCRHSDLRPEPCRHRRIAAYPSHGGAVQGPVVERDGAVGIWIDHLSDADPRRP